MTEESTIEAWRGNHKTRDSSQIVPTTAHPFRDRLRAEEPPKTPHRALFGAAEPDRQLDDNARDFMRVPTKNRYDAADHRLVASKIFKWFSTDFAAAWGPQGYSTPHGPPEPAAAMSRAPDRPTVVFGAYDWSLNE